MMRAKRVIEKRFLRSHALLVWLAQTLCAAPGCTGTGPTPSAVSRPASAPVGVASASAKPSGVDRLRMDAAKLAPTVTSPFVRKFLAATALLPRVAPRTLYRDEKKTRFYDARAYAALPAGSADRLGLAAMTADEELYYNTKYGSPLSYARPLDVLAQHGAAIAPGWRVLDFGYGYVGHLRLLASLGLDASGVDVDPLLQALYGEAGDQGEIAGDGVKGTLRLFHGEFPKDPAIVARVGRGYDVIVSKNVLKKGYIHPERPADKRFLIDLGADDGAVLASFFAALKPGGWFLIYNICPALTPPDKPFVPWSDGRSPYTRAQWEGAGFEVVALDVDDAPAVSRIAHVLGWADDPEDPWDVDHDLSVLYTLVRRPR
jgi:SAM-dependent methyltransferase